MPNMPGRPPVTYPSEQRRLRALGERLRLARLRRRFSVALVAERAGISRTTLYHVERGDTAVTFGAVVRVLSVLGLGEDLDALAAADPVGRALQDAALPRRGRSM